MLWSGRDELYGYSGGRMQERKSWTKAFTAGSCQWGVSGMRAGGGKDL